MQPVLAVDPDAPQTSPRPHTCRKGKSNTKDAEDKKKLLLTVAAGVAAITAIVLGVKKAREVSSAVQGESMWYIKVASFPCCGALRLGSLLILF